MNAVGHGASALLIKRFVPEANLPALLIATELVEFFWLAFNAIGLEHTRLDQPFQSVSNLHLVDMPWSHSILAGLTLSALAYLGGQYLWKSHRIGLALACAVFSHIILDIALHGPDMPISPFDDLTKLGTGLYSDHPYLAYIVELIYPIFCWTIFKGHQKRWGLLAIMIGLNLFQFPYYSPTIDFGEAELITSLSPFLLNTTASILLTLGLIGWFARDRPN